MAQLPYRAGLFDGKTTAGEVTVSETGEVAVAAAASVTVAVKV